MPETACLHIQARDSDLIRVVELAGSSVRIGRASYCEVRLGEPELADEECRLKRRGGAWQLVPSRSSGRVSIEGRSLDSTCALPFDVPFRVGEHWLTLRPTGSAAPDWREYRSPEPSISASAPLRDESRPLSPVARVREESSDLFDFSPAPPRATPPADYALPSPQKGRQESPVSRSNLSPEERLWENRWRAAGERVRSRPAVKAAPISTVPPTAAPPPVSAPLVARSAPPTSRRTPIDAATLRDRIRRNVAPIAPVDRRVPINPAPPVIPTAPTVKTPRVEPASESPTRSAPDLERATYPTIVNRIGASPDFGATTSAVESPATGDVSNAADVLTAPVSTPIDFVPIDFDRPAVPDESAPTADPDSRTNGLSPAPCPSAETTNRSVSPLESAAVEFEPESNADSPLAFASTLAAVPPVVEPEVVESPTATPLDLVDVLDRESDSEIAAPTRPIVDEAIDADVQPSALDLKSLDRPDLGHEAESISTLDEPSPVAAEIEVETPVVAEAEAAIAPSIDAKARATVDDGLDSVSASEVSGEVDFDATTKVEEPAEAESVATAALNAAEPTTENAVDGVRNASAGPEAALAEFEPAAEVVEPRGDAEVESVTRSDDAAKVGAGAEVQGEDVAQPLPALDQEPVPTADRSQADSFVYRAELEAERVAAPDLDLTTSVHDASWRTSEHVDPSPRTAAYDGAGRADADSSRTAQAQTQVPPPAVESAWLPTPPPPSWDTSSDARREPPPNGPKPSAANREWPSARDILASHRASVQRAAAPRSARVRTPFKAPALTEVQEPAHWTFPLWLGWPPAFLVVFVVGLSGLYLSWNWCSDARWSGTVAGLLSRSGATVKPLPDTVPAPSGAWWKSTPANLMLWATYFDRRAAVEPVHAEKAIELLNAASHASPIQSQARFALARRHNPRDEAPGAALTPSLGLSQDVEAQTWLGRQLLQSGKKEAALKVYRRALEMAARAELARQAPPAFDEDSQILRYYLPGEDLAARVVQDMAEQTNWSFADWKQALPHFALIPLSAARLLRQQGSGDADAALALVLERLDEPAPEGCSPVLHLAAQAEALALKSRWQEAESRYRQAIEQMPNDLISRSWWLNLAEIDRRLNDESGRQAALGMAKGTDANDEIAQRAVDLLKFTAPRADRARAQR